MKKLAALAGAGALLAVMAGPVLGICMGPYCGGGGSDDVTISNYKTSVKTRVKTKADSGDNSIGGMMVCGGLITTGAATARSDLYTDVNSSVVECDACDGDVDISNDRTRVRTRVYTKADSGDNSIGGMFVSGGRINTGAAGATSIVDSIVNFSWVAGEVPGP